MSIVTGNVDHIVAQIEALLLKVKREEEEVEYRNWIEGILNSAVAVLKVAR